MWHSIPFEIQQSIKFNDFKTFRKSCSIFNLSRDDFIAAFKLFFPTIKLVQCQFTKNQIHRKICTVHHINLQKNEYIKNSLMQLLHLDVYVLARIKDREGNKLDKYKLYSVDIVNILFRPFRYAYVSAIGEYNAHNIIPTRFWVKIDNFLRYKHWKDNNEDLNLVQKSSSFEDGDTFLESYGKDVDNFIDYIPLFGYMDNGYVLARNAQTICINPFSLLI